MLRAFLGLIIAAITTLAGGIAAPAPAAAGADDLFVIVANEKYRNLHDVAYARRDGAAMADLARRVLGLPRERIIIEEDAGLSTLRELFGSREQPGRIARLLTGRKARRIWVYFSGHGVPGSNRDGWLLPVDGRPDRPELTAIARAELEDILLALRRKHAPEAQLVLILEACFSGLVDAPDAAGSAGKAIAPEASRGPVKISPTPPQPGMTVLAAAKGDGIASWDREAQQGLFTELFLRAVFTGAERSAKGEVTLGAIEAYVAREMGGRLERLFPGRGRSQMADLVGPRDLVLLTVPAGLVQSPEAAVQAQVLCNGLRHAPKPEPIDEFLRSKVCERGCTPACRTALEARRQELIDQASACEAALRALEQLIKSKPAKAVLDAARASLPPGCTIPAAAEPPKRAAPAPEPKAAEERARHQAAADIWERIKSTTDLGVVERFIAAHGDAPVVAEARGRRAALREQRAAEAWARVKASEDVAAIRKVLADWPDTRVVPEAERRLAALEAQRREQEAREARAAAEWEVIKDTRDVALIERFIAAHEGTSAAHVARSQLAGLTLARTHRLVPQVGHARYVWAVAVSPDGRLIVSGSDDNTVKVWEAATGRLVRTLEGHKYWVEAVAVSPDGRLIVSGSRDKTVKVWEAATGRLVRTLEGHKDWVHAVAVSPDGRFVLSRDDVNTLKRWDLATGREAPIEPGDKATLDAARTPVGYAFAGSTIRALRDDGSERFSLTTLPGGHWVAIGPDGVTYTGSPGVEAHIHLVERDGFATRPLDDAFVKAHRRDALDLRP